eukprot:14961342-Alexandrium_andersonii.AAC.1
MRKSRVPTCFAWVDHLVQVRGGFQQHLRTWRLKQGTVAVLAQYGSRGGDHCSATMKVGLCNCYCPFLEPPCSGGAREYESDAPNVL